MQQSQNSQVKICSLEQYALFEVLGEDAQSFLQGQLTCDLYKLAIGQSTLTAHCDPKGKVFSLLRIIPISAQQFYVLIHRDIAEQGLAQLKKYAVFSKVSFQRLDWQILGVIYPIALHDNLGITGEIQIDLPAFQQEDSKSMMRKILLNSSAQNDSINVDISHWQRADIQTGLPILSAQSQGEFIPQALNLQAIEQAISFQKGCYIGQETVARAKYRGINKRAMFAFYCATESVDLPTLNSEIEMQLGENWRNTGSILSAVHIEGKLWLQVVMNNQFEENSQFRWQGNVLEFCQPSYSLEDKA